MKKNTVTTNKDEYVVEGKVYKTLKAISEEYDISLSGLSRRKNKGYEGDDLIPMKKRKSYIEPVKEINLPFIAGGIGYKSAAMACAALGVKYGTYHSRISKGQSREQALNIEEVKSGSELRTKEYQVNGQQKTIKELSALYNISISAIRNHLQRGATIRQAVKLDPIPRGSLKGKPNVKKNKAIHLEVHGKVYTSYKKLADAYGLPVYVVSQRIQTYGYTPEEAVTLEGKGKPVTVEGICHSSITAAAAAYGKAPNDVFSAMDKGKTIEQALGIEIKENSRTVRYNGDIYESIVALAEKENIPPRTLYKRCYEMSLEEAIAAGPKIIGQGRYSSTALEKDSDQGNQVALLYLVELLIDGKKYLKVGITTKTVKSRLHSQPYEYKVIKTVKGTLLDCLKLEQDIIASHADKRDPAITSKMLSGYTEVFTFSKESTAIIISKMDSLYS